MQILKDMKIEFAPDNKIDDFSYELVKIAFDLKSALITNESILEDFAIRFTPKNKRISKKGWSKIRKSVLAKIENKFKISLEEYPNDEPLYIWKVAKLVKSKLKES